MTTAHLVLAPTLSYFQAIIMGLLQGVTELFPISSLGHGVLLPALLGWHNLVSSQAQRQSFFLTFLVGLHVGTALGLLAYYRSTWFTLFMGLGRQLKKSRTSGISSLWRINDAAIDRNYRRLFIILIGSIPVGIAGILLEKELRVLFAKPLAAAIFLTINGIIFIAIERLMRTRGKHVQMRKLDNLSARSAISIGSAQVLALFAGISRSGVTIGAGLLGDLTHEDAATFSFLLATPVILGAGLYKLPSLMGHLGDGVRMQTLVGAIFAFVASYFSVKFLTKWFSSKNLVPFGVYCIIVGLLCVIRFA